MKNKYKIVYKKGGSLYDYTQNPELELNLENNNQYFLNDELLLNISILINQINIRDGILISYIEDDDFIDLINIKNEIKKIKKKKYKIDNKLLLELDKIKIVMTSILGLDTNIKKRRERWNNEVNNLIKFVFNKFIITNFYEKENYKNQFIKEVHLNFNNNTEISYFYNKDILNVILYPTKQGKELIESYDLNKPIDSNGNTIYHYISKKEEYIKIHNYLIDKKKIYATNNYNNQIKEPVSIAIENLNEKIIEYLIDNLDPKQIKNKESYFFDTLNEKYQEVDEIGKNKIVYILKLIIYAGANFTPEQKGAEVQLIKWYDHYIRKYDQDIINNLKKYFEKFKKFCYTNDYYLNNNEECTIQISKYIVKVLNNFNKENEIDEKNTKILEDIFKYLIDKKQINNISNITQKEEIEINDKNINFIRLYSLQTIDKINAYNNEKDRERARNTNFQYLKEQAEATQRQLEKADRKAKEEAGKKELGDILDIEKEQREEAERKQEEQEKLTEIQEVNLNIPEIEKKINQKKKLEKLDDSLNQKSVLKINIQKKTKKQNSIIKIKIKEKVKEKLENLLNKELINLNDNIKKLIKTEKDEIKLKNLYQNFQNISNNLSLIKNDSKILNKIPNPLNINIGDNLEIIIEKKYNELKINDININNLTNQLKNIYEKIGINKNSIDLKITEGSINVTVKINSNQIKEIQLPNGIYIGEFYENKLIKSIIKYNNENIYEGEVNENYKPDGEGIMTFKNSDIFEGKFINGIPIKGKITHEDNENKENNYVYIGDVDEIYQFDGEGTMTFFYGNYYKGEWSKNNLINDVTIKFENGDIFKGNVGTNLKDNNLTSEVYGTYTYNENNNKISYEGYFKDNFQFNGNGTMKFKNGEIFEGTFKNDIPIIGKYTYINKDVYDGQVNDEYEPNVEGKMTFQNGEFFEGTFEKGIPKNGKFEYKFHQIYLFYEGDVNENYKPIPNKIGKYKLKYHPDSNPDLDEFLGKINENEEAFHGTLTYYNKNVYDGEVNEYLNPDGNGTMKFKNGEIFEGTFKNDIPIIGKYTYINKDVYDGEVNKNYEPDGVGEIKNKDNLLYEGKWKNGKIIKNSVLKIEIQSKAEKERIAKEEADRIAKQKEEEEKQKEAERKAKEEADRIAKQKEEEEKQREEEEKQRKAEKQREAEEEAKQKEEEEKQRKAEEAKNQKKPKNKESILQIKIQQKPKKQNCKLEIEIKSKIAKEREAKLQKEKDDQIKKKEYEEKINIINTENFSNNKELINKILDLEDNDLKNKLYKKLFSLVLDNLRKLNIEDIDIEIEKNNINIKHNNIDEIKYIIINELNKFKDYYNIKYNFN